jgi:DNA polymerase-3 subunit epsilon
MLWIKFLWLRCQQLFYRRRLLKSRYGNLLLNCWDKSFNPFGLEAFIKCSEAEFLVADLEMSSLDAKEGEILSIGWVIIKKGKIQLASAEHHLLKTKKSVGQSATIHNLRDCELDQGRNMMFVVERFLQLAAGKVLVFHHSPLDMAYLNKASHELFSSPILLPIVDTLSIEKKNLLRTQDHIKTGELRLSECRSRYNLPAYPAHNALMDSLSAAELLLAQLDRKGNKVPLADMLHLL